MIALLLSLLFAQPTKVDRVDVAELMHLHRPDDGSLVQSYWLWWVAYDDSGYHIADWRHAAGIPRPTDGVQEWYDPKAKVHRRVESRVFTQTRVLHDREREDLRAWGESKRRKLR